MNMYSLNRGIFVMPMPFTSWFYKTETLVQLPRLPTCPYDLDKFESNLKELHCKGVLAIVAIQSDSTVLPELLRENAKVLKQICDLKVYENKLIESLEDTESIKATEPEELEESLIKKHDVDLERCERELRIIGKLIDKYEKCIFTLLRIELPLLGIDIKQERLLIEQEKLEQEQRVQEEAGSEKKLVSKSYFTMPTINPQLWFVIGGGVSVIAANIIILGATTGAALPILSKVEVSGLGAGGLALLYYKNYIQEREFDKMHRYVMEGDESLNFGSLNLRPLSKYDDDCDL